MSQPAGTPGIGRSRSDQRSGAASAAAEVEWRQRAWRSGWRRYVFPGLWLIYLGQTGYGIHQHASGWGAVAGYVILLAFAACYLIALSAGWTGLTRRFWWLYAATLVLTALELPLAHDDAFVFCVYIAVLTVAAATRFTVAIVAALAVVTLVTPRLVPSWGGEFDFQGALTVVLVGLAMYGFFAIIRSNVQLAAARAEVARLAAENERSRIARDLHDLLGHSLTTITVKAGLARRLVTRDPERAADEIAEVEALSRRSLADVRAAVSGYREVTLAGELASAREVLAAAAVTADLPGAVDVVDSRLSELFGWVVREGITNVVRHARAHRCTVTLGPNWIEIVDDGRGGSTGPGNGLLGLRERVEAVGGSVQAGGCPQGWRLRVEVSEPGEWPSGPTAEQPAEDSRGLPRPGPPERSRDQASTTLPR
jgi:two-component system sensor histidine kinase DesK